MKWQTKRKPKGLQNTVQVRLYPTSEQSRLLMAHAQEYISTVNVLVSALDADLIPHGDTFSTKDFVAALPSCVKNQALRDAHSVFKRSLELDCIPVLKKPICQWNNQNWNLKQVMLRLPIESLAGIRKGTTRTSRGASARKNNRMKNTWSFYQLTLFITYKAERLGIKVELVDQNHPSFMWVSLSMKI